MSPLWTVGGGCGVLFVEQRVAGRDNTNDRWAGRILHLFSWKPTWVNPALSCCAETACIYICRGSCCFERSVDKTEQLIIPKYSRRATDDPCRTCRHGGSAGVPLSGFYFPLKFQRRLLPECYLSKQHQYSTDIGHVKVPHCFNIH